MCILLHVKSRTQRDGYWGDFQCELFPVEQMVSMLRFTPPAQRGTTVQTPDLLKWRLGPSLQPDPEFQARLSCSSSCPLLLKSLTVCSHRSTFNATFQVIKKKNTAKLKKINYSTKLQDKNWPFYNSGQNNSKQNNSCFSGCSHCRTLDLSLSMICNHCSLYIQLSQIQLVREARTSGCSAPMSFD